MSKFVLSQGLGHELEMAIGRTGGDTSDVQWLRTGSNFENVMLLARGQARLAQNEVSPSFDPIVRVDRSVRPVYPYFLNQEYLDSMEFIALERMSPPDFNVGKLRKWLHPKQKNGVVGGNIIHDFLKQKDMLPSCLGFADLLCIQAKGVEFFRRYFKDKAVFGWRSVVPYCDGGLLVPFLVEKRGEAALYWRWLADVWDANNPALRFANLFVSPLKSRTLRGVLNN